jgi:hypothetical protein
MTHCACAWRALSHGGSWRCAAELLVLWCSIPCCLPALLDHMTACSLGLYLNLELISNKRTSRLVVCTNSGAVEKPWPYLHLRMGP